jgi:hypothetical protein
MWLNKAYIWASVALFVSLGLALLFMLPGDSREARVHQCDREYDNETAKIDCWYGVISDAFEEEGTREAFDLFEYVYASFNEFSNSGCHRHAHRVGDMAYYFDYVNHRDLSLVEFPKNANSCGYGFYHGFFEHMVQDVPDPQFVTETCEYLADTIASTAPAISQTCYHGAGHGFVFARADVLTREHEWSPQAFVEEPLALCESLPKANEHEISKCQEGVFNVLVDWMADGEYGLSYDYEQPFLICEEQEEQRREACYYEMAQKMDRASGNDPLRIIDFALRPEDPKIQQMIMAVGVAGIVQHDPTDDQSQLAMACNDIEHELLQEACFTGIIAGLVEHGVSGDYTNAAVFCESELLTEDVREQCYRTLQNKLERFETEGDIQRMCEDGYLPERFCIEVQT